MQTVSKIFVQLGITEPANSKVSLKDDNYQRQPGKAAGGYTLKKGEPRNCVCSDIKDIGSWSVSINLRVYVCIQGPLNSCVERVKEENVRDPPSIHD